MAEVEPHTQLLAEILGSLNELLALARLVSRPTTTEILESVLDTDDKRRVYQLLDGQTSMAAISQATGVNSGRISEWSQEWEKIGLVRPSAASGVKGRRGRVLDLGVYGIRVSGTRASEGGPDARDAS